MKRSTILKVLTVGVMLVVLLLGNGSSVNAAGKTVGSYGYQKTSSRYYSHCYKPIFRPCYRPCYKPVYKPCYKPCYNPCGGGNSELRY